MASEPINNVVLWGKDIATGVCDYFSLPGISTDPGNTIVPDAVGDLFVPASVAPIQSVTAQLGAENTGTAANPVIEMDIDSLPAGDETECAFNIAVSQGGIDNQLNVVNRNEDQVPIFGSGLFVTSGTIANIAMVFPDPAPFQSPIGSVTITNPSPCRTALVRINGNVFSYFIGGPLSTGTNVSGYAYIQIDGGGFVRVGRTGGDNIVDGERVYNHSPFFQDVFRYIPAGGSMTIDYYSTLENDAGAPTTMAFGQADIGISWTGWLI